LSEIGGKGVFVKEIQAAVLQSEADIAVHSAKDLPSETQAGLALAAALERADPRDALVGCQLEDLPRSATVATGAPRRRALLKRHRPDLKLVNLRGNIATRLQALKHCAAVLVAAAAMERLSGDVGRQVVDLLDPKTFVPQVGQGVIATECRDDDAEMIGLLGQINHQPSMRCLAAERAFLSRLGGDCNLPAGAYAQFRSEATGLTSPAGPGQSQGSSAGLGQSQGLAAGPGQSQGSAAGLGQSQGSAANPGGSILGFLEGRPQVLEVAGDLWEHPAELGVELADSLLAS